MALVVIERYTEETADDESDIGQISTITIKYSGGIFTLDDCWRDHGITSAKWLELLTPGKELFLGCDYGSHVDNGTVSIEHTVEGNLRFCVDGARGGILSYEIPIEEVQMVITEIAQEFKKEV